MATVDREILRKPDVRLGLSLEPNALGRLVQVLIAFVGLILLSPLLGLIALAVKLTSPGPILYRGERVGKDERTFTIYKFRTLAVGAEKQIGARLLKEEDHLYTRIGKLLKKTKLDEIPQLFNVIKGDMSLVGPRPEQPAFVEKFRAMIPRYMERHREKAGITGWAQVNGLRGDTSIVERTKYDLWYIENWSIWLDVKILVRTAMRVFADRNAY